MTGIICAMSNELSDVLAALTERVEEEIHGSIFYRGKIGKEDVVLVKCGVGKVNAARITQMMIDRYDPDAIINSGIAGGLAECLSLGDVVVGTEFVQHDVDVCVWGYAKGYMWMGDPDKPTLFQADQKLVDDLYDAALEISEKGLSIMHEDGKRYGAEGVSAWKGRIASGDQFIADMETKLEIRDYFDAMAVEMEGAAIAQTAEMAGVPYAVIRVISDLADGDCHVVDEETENYYTSLSAQTVLNYFNNL